MFLYTKNNFLSSKICNDFINNFEQSPQKHSGVTSNSKGIVIKEGKKSTDLTIDPSFLNSEVWEPLLKIFIPLLDNSKMEYINKFSTAFKEIDYFEIDPLFNIQRYLPNESFSTYHCERAGHPCLNRVLVWMVYLNTINDGGETEFYYQNHLESPQQGKLVIWPSDWTYLHRGLPAPNETKYILTGWFSHPPN